MKRKEKLKILLLEDNAEDAENVQRLLKKENLNCEFRVVVTHEDYLNSLNNFQPDLILSDNSLPQFNATEALNILQQQSLHIPFILVTCPVSEEFAAKIIKAGATDYILKDRLIRLPEAIDAALKQKKIEKEKQEAEKKVRESEEEYRILVEQAADGIFIADMQGKFIAVNSSGCTMSQYSEEELLKMKIFDLAIQEDIQRNPFRIDEMRQGKTVVVERIMRRKDGEAIDVETTGKILSDGRMLVFVRDISERKKAAEALSSNERRFRTLTSNAPVGIFQTDAAGKTIYVNETWLEYTGLSYSEAMGDGWHKVVHPDDKELQLKQWEEKSKNGLESSSEFRLIDKKRKIRWVISKATPIFHNGGQLSGYIGTLSDMTANKKAAELLSERENHLKTILNTEPECIKQMNKKCELIDMNPAGLGMIEADNLGQVIGKPLSEIVNKNYRKAFKELNNHVFNGNAGTLEFEITGLKGTRRWLETHAVPLKDNNGNIVSSLGITRDITVRKKAEEEIKNTTEQLRLLTAHQQNIREEERAHIAREIHDELGQQLTVMKMDVSWLNKKFASTDEEVAKKTQELAKILDETVKTVRRIASELRPSLLDDLGLAAAIEWLLSEFEKRSGIKTEFKDIDTVLSLPDTLKTGLFRIVQESLTNVARYAQASKVIITITQKEKQLILTIKDNGVGFDKEKIAAKKTLGILGMKERTMMMGGIYEIISVPGKGTTVTVNVPA